MRLQSLNRAQRVRKQALDGTSTPVDGDGEGDADVEAEVEGDREVDADHEAENHHDDHPHDQEMHDSASNDIDNDTIPRKRFRPYSDDSSTENSMGESSLPEHIPEAPVRVGEMELVFRPHPQEAEPDAVNTLRFIKTTSNATGRYYTSGICWWFEIDSGTCIKTGHCVTVWRGNGFSGNGLSFLFSVFEGKWEVCEQNIRFTKEQQQQHKYALILYPDQTVQIKPQSTVGLGVESISLNSSCFGAYYRHILILRKN